MAVSSILWRRLDQEGHEAARLIERPAAWYLEGTAVFASDERPCRLDYQIVIDQHWATQGATIQGWVGDTVIDLTIAVDPERRWSLNGSEAPAVQGCIDLDLNFSPATNLLPICRLALHNGQAAPVRAAWLRFPSFALEPLDQEYMRIDAGRYRYSSADGGFTADLAVRPDGFVTSYAGLWQMVAGQA